MEALDALITYLINDIEDAAGGEESVELKTIAPSLKILFRNMSPTENILGNGYRHSVQEYHILIDVSLALFTPIRLSRKVLGKLGEQSSR